MTTRIEIKCKGPDALGIWFYDCHGNRTPDLPVLVAVGDSFEFDTHDGKRAMPFAVGPAGIKETPRAADGEIRGYTVPPAHY